MPQHSDIVELALFKFLNEKYHKYSNTGRLDICPLMETPRDFMYFTCMGEFEKTSEYVFIAHHYDIYENFSEVHLKKFISWRDLNISSWCHSSDNPALFVFVISENKENLILSDDIINIVNNNADIHIFRLLYRYSDMSSPTDGKFYYLIEINDKNEEIYMY